MPCYEAPPPWEDKYRQNAEKAAALLCGVVTSMLDTGCEISRDLLTWYVEHREIDFEIATVPYYSKPDPAAAAKAMEDAARAKARL